MGGGASGSANSICSAECIASISLVLVLCILPLSAHVRTNSRDSLYVFPDPFDRAETYFLKGDYESALPIYEHLVSSCIFIFFFFVCFSLALSSSAIIASILISTSTPICLYCSCVILIN